MRSRRIFSYISILPVMVLWNNAAFSNGSNLVSMGGLKGATTSSTGISAPARPFASVSAPANAKSIKNAYVGKQSGFFKPVKFDNAYVFDQQVANIIQTQFVPWANSLKSALKVTSHTQLPPDDPNHVLLSASQLGDVISNGAKPERQITGNALDSERVLTLREAHLNLKADYNRAVVHLVKTNSKLLQKNGVVNYVQDIIKVFDGAAGSF